MFLKESKAQGALEYLLIIAGAILIAAIVISVIVATTKKGKETTESKFEDFNKIVDVNVEEAVQQGQ